MLRAISSRESRMREIRTYGLMRERALTGPSLLYFKFSEVGACWRSRAFPTNLIALTRNWTEEHEVSVWHLKRPFCS
jgi:hypothetical protein